MISLSILICSTHTRRKTFLPKCMEMLFGQYESLTKSDKDRVEILFLTDNKKIMLGEKRNVMVDMAQGKYVVFVDDDDTVEADYIATLLKATESGADCISFKAKVSINGAEPKICHYSKDYRADFNKPDGYYRLPNHICCIRKECAMKASFPNIKYGEDAAYARLLVKHLRTEHKIDRVLYNYDYNDMTTEAQEDLPSVRMKRRAAIPPVVDVVMLSKATSPAMKAMTQKAIDTCIAGANELSVNVIVIEQMPHTQYKDAKTVYHTAPFNYNAFMNLGARQGKAPWVMFANNDLIFKSGWLHNLLTADWPLVSPKCPRDARQVGVNRNELGEQNGRNLSGWCFMMSRELWSAIGGLDEEFSGWYADDSAMEQCKRLNVLPMLVPTALVEHLGSTTLKQLPQSERDDLCWGKLERFNEKYGQNKFHDNPNYLKWKQERSQLQPETGEKSLSGRMRNGRNTCRSAGGWR